jgi:hypothetical protein
MAEVTIYINGRSYDIACDNGQEGRIVDLAKYIDQRVQQISRSGSAYNDAHLTVRPLAPRSPLQLLQHQPKRASARKKRALS